MAFVVQTDEGDASGANALISVAYFRTYHTDAGVDLTGKTDAQIQTAIVQATRYIDGRFAFVGTAISTNTCWPRSGAYIGRTLITGIPDAIERGVAEYALITLLGTSLYADPLADASGRVVQETESAVGPVSERTVYAVSPAAGGRIEARPPTFPIADRIIIRSSLTKSSASLVRS